MHEVGHPLWFSTGLSSMPELDVDAFVRAGVETLTWGGKPAAGLLTSDGSGDDLGMWHVQLRRDAAAHDRPWRAWCPHPHLDAAVLTIASAVQWCEAAIEHGRDTPAGRVLDWHALAEKFDGVHVTIAAAAATDAVFFTYKGARVAPTFWGVETTVWLEFPFSTVHEVAASGRGTSSS